MFPNYLHRIRMDWAALDTTTAKMVEEIPTFKEEEDHVRQAAKITVA